ncbi:magnesium transporter NIPA-domain-containing protein [Rhizophagus clarus]|uniref:Magnesium transporter NIPA-domain-containing protein n=1 Tax=Rhizophagus clarus TaxID=94130 RepID=A0A8H3L3P0_9GLOM|nr:magnesium transporter NIPA-domain-containing protein [Rhizophagus clarus]
MYKSIILALIFLLSQTLLVSSQSTIIESQINNRSCNFDSDCVDNNLKDNIIRLGNFMCINNSCKFVVAAGQNCRDATDCVAYHYSNLYNISLGSDICSKNYCNIESKCDRAWDQKDISSIPKIEDLSTCCIGLSDNTECEIVANGVDPCALDSDCRDYGETNSKKCVNENDEDQKKHVWIGVLICLVGSTTLNIGLNVQKYAFTKHQEELNHFATSHIQDGQQVVTITDDDDDKNSTRNSIESLQRSALYRKLEKFMFWKQIIVSPIWGFGFTIYVIGSLLSFIALKFAPQSLVAPLGAVSLVINLLIAPILHNQKLTISDSIGVIIIIAGSVVITIFSGIVMEDYKLCALIELFKRVQTIIYLSVIGVFIFSLFTFIRLVEKNAIQKDKDAIVEASAIVAELTTTDEEKKSETILVPTIHITNFDTVNNDDNRSSRRLSIRLDNGNRKSLTGEINPTLSLSSLTADDNPETNKTTRDITLNKDDNILPEDVPLPRNSITSIRTTRSVVRQRSIKEKVLLPLAYAILASSMATITTLFAKSLINLLSTSFVQHDNQFKDLLSWTILFITVLTAISQVYWINMGLKKYDALLQVPVFYCNWSLFDIIGALLSKRLSKLTKEEEELKEIQKQWEQEMRMKKMNNKSDSRKKIVN